MDQQETFPKDFTCAAKSEEEPVIIYLSSDEDGYMVCSDSVEDLVSSSDEETQKSS